MRGRELNLTRAFGGGASRCGDLPPHNSLVIPAGVLRATSALRIRRLADTGGPALPAGDVGVGGGGDDDEHEVDEEVREARACFLSMAFSGSDSGARAAGWAAAGVGRAGAGAGRAGRGAWRTLECRGGRSSRQAARLGERLRQRLERLRPRLERLRSRPERGEGLRPFRSGEGCRLP